MTSSFSTLLVLGLYFPGVSVRQPKAWAWIVRLSGIICCPVPWKLPNISLAIRATNEETPISYRPHGVATLINDLYNRNRSRRVYLSECLWSKDVEGPSCRLTTRLTGFRSR